MDQASLPELPTSEEVYDFDSFALKELVDMIRSHLDSGQELPKSWLKRANRVLELSELELKERHQVESFGEYCITASVTQYTKVNLQDIAQCNQALEQILMDLKNRPQNYLDHTGPTMAPIVEHDQDDEDRPTQNLTSSQVTEFSQVSKFNRTKHLKKANMHDFMKNLLQQTRVTDTQVVGAPINGKYIPTLPQPELTAQEKIKLAKLQKKNDPLPRVVQTHNVQQGQMQQALMLGKPTYSNRDRVKQADKRKKEQEEREQSQKRKSSQHRSEKSRQHTVEIKASKPSKQLKTGASVKDDQQTSTSSRAPTGSPSHHGSQAFNVASNQSLPVDEHYAEEALVTEPGGNNLNLPGKTNISVPDVNKTSIPASQLNTQEIASNQTSLTQEGNEPGQINPVQNLSQLNNQATREINPGPNLSQLNNPTQTVNPQTRTENLQHIQSMTSLQSTQRQVEESEVSNHNEFMESITKHGHLTSQLDQLRAQQGTYGGPSHEEVVKDIGEQSDGTRPPTSTLSRVTSIRPREEPIPSEDDEIQENYEGEESEDDIKKRAQNHLKKTVRVYSNTKMNDDKRQPLQEASQKSMEQMRAEIEQYRSHEEKPNPQTMTTNVATRAQHNTQSRSNATESKSALAHETSSNPRGKIERNSKPDSSDYHEQRNSKHEQPANSDLAAKFSVTNDPTSRPPLVTKPDPAAKPPLTTKPDPSNKQEPTAKKPRVPVAPRPKANPQASQQSKYIMKMLDFINDDNLVDYSAQIPTFQQLFSGYQNAPNTYSHIESMREIYQLFQQHVERVDNVDTQLAKYRQSALQFQPQEIVYINDPTKIIVHAQKTGIDLQSYIQRQMVFNSKISPEDEPKINEPTMYFRVIKTKEEVYDIITRSFMRKKNWSELPHGIALKTSWNVLWTWSKPQIDMNKLLLFQRVNHFPFNKNISRKDLLKKNIERCQRLGPKAMQCFDIIPCTYLLPKEYVPFMERFYADMEREGPYNFWIMKPTSKSRGRGIQVVNDISQIMYAEPVVLQKYLKDPLLLRGFKFDMRIYVLVTSFNPLEAFLYKEGFARMATQQFSLELNDLKNLIIHLTNYAVQKHHVDASNENSFGGSKISLRQLREQLQQKGVDWKHIWTQVQEIILKSLIAVQPEIPNNQNGFELFGYDIIIDQSKRCWLLEVNASPSLARDYILDELIKQQLIDDIFDLLRPPYFDRQRLSEVLERRILEEQGCKSTINTTNNSKLQLNRDINYILHGQPIRKVGEMPAQMGGFERLAPGETHDKIHKLVQSYKIQGVGRGTID